MHANTRTYIDSMQKEASCSCQTRPSPSNVLRLRIAWRKRARTCSEYNMYIDSMQKKDSCVCQTRTSPSIVYAR